MEQPTSLDITYMAKHVSEDLQPNLIAAFTVSLVLACTAVGLRLVARWRVQACLKADDWFILMALGMMIAFSVDSFMMVHYGLGRHIITVTNMAGLVQSIVAGEVLYSSSIVPIKISILSLYSRLFPFRTLFRTSIGLGMFILCYTFAQAICMMLQCIPLASLWTHEGGQCININAVLITTGVLNVLTDLVIIALPLPFLIRLQIPKSRKTQLFGMFALGGCVTIFGIVRAVMVGVSDARDFSWSNSNGLLWSVLEIGFGIVSACLPTLRPLFISRSALRNGSNSTRNEGNPKSLSSSGTDSRPSNLHNLADMEPIATLPRPCGEQEKQGFGRAALAFLGFNRVQDVDEVADVRGPWAKLADAEKAECDTRRPRAACPSQIFVRTEIGVQHDKRWECRHGREREGQAWAPHQAVALPSDSPRRT